MRCAIYARYSSDLQREKSLDDQIRNCRNMAEQKGWLVLEKHIYADKAVSGSSLEGRTQLTRMVAAAASTPCPFDYILIDDTSRLSRDRNDQTNLIADFQYAGTQLYFVSQSIDTADEQANDVVLPIHGIVPCT
ncbi:MAG: recombinase family protein [candidate division Zixibacteria bacterium]|nr:recombinase family protein [candidate division Zixibacteria bacterium]MBU2626480.1 recombinase family protein [candidate division Zixibacteria bacterium]